MHLRTKIANIQDKPIIYRLYEEAMKPHIEKIWGWDQSWQENDFEQAFESSGIHIIAAVIRVRYSGSCRGELIRPYIQGNRMKKKSLGYSISWMSRAISILELCD